MSCRVKFANFRSKISRSAFIIYKYREIELMRARSIAEKRLAEMKGFLFIHFAHLSITADCKLTR